MAQNRYNKYTQHSQPVELFSDFLMDFDLNKDTGDVVRNINVFAVQSSLKNILLTNKGERFYQPGVGSDLRRRIFELYESSTIEFLKQDIQLAIEAFEPRVKYEDCSIVPSDDNNGLFVSVFFSTIQQPGRTFELTVFLERVR